MGNSVRDINILKSRVKQLIEENSHREVTSQTEYKTSGIYMIYIGTILQVTKLFLINFIRYEKGKKRQIFY